VITAGRNIQTRTEERRRIVLKNGAKKKYSFLKSVADRNIQLPEIIINNFPKKRGSLALIT